jgi:hypothetical protein
LAPPRGATRDGRPELPGFVGAQAALAPADPLKSPRTGASSPRPLYLTECLLIGPKENAA